MSRIYPKVKRKIVLDGDPNQIPTKDKRFIWVDCYARWRITDPLLFFQPPTPPPGEEGDSLDFPGRGRPLPAVGWEDGRGSG